MLCDSLSKAEPNARLHLFLADRLPDADWAGALDDRIVLVGIDKLAIDDLDDMTFRYSILELNTAIKPFCFDYLFDVLGFDAAIYMDPDILVLNPLDHVRSALACGASCLLTPHITQSLNDGRHPSEDTFLTCGVFNLGFAAFANVLESREFIRWWGHKTRYDCVVALARGIFVDQSYCNFAPCFLDRLQVLRNPGYNVAYWNLAQRRINRNGENYRIGDELVRFVHFSGLEPRDPTSFSKHQNRFTRRNVGALAELVDRYVAELDQRDRYGSGRFSEIPYAFGSFRNGRPIHDLLRIAYRCYKDDWPAAQSPFDIDPAFFNAPAQNYPSFSGITLSRLYAIIWERRVDLQQRFDLRTPRGQADFLIWAINGLPRDYGIGAPFVQPISLTAGEFSSASEWRQIQRDRLLDRAVTSRWFMVRNLLRRQTLGESRVRDYWERRLNSPPTSSNLAKALSVGVDVHGFFKAETGVGQAARGVVLALRETTIRFGCHTMNTAGTFENNVAFEDLYGQEEMYDTALICANADIVMHLEQHTDPRRLLGRRKLAYWAWELPVFPAAWAVAFHKVDEIWAPSRFVARSIQSATDKVVRLVPFVVQTMDIGASEARTALNLPQEPYIFLTTFDFNSFPSRKNPIATIRAFRSAFSDATGQSPLLVVKYHGRYEVSEYRQALAEAIAGDPHIVEIDAVYSPERMNLLKAACNAFVSLHRSEGFGLNIAEAMAAGELAIATNFSGNEDFMTEDTSIPIPFKMIPVGKGEYPQGAGQWWAEPDHDAAVEAMRWAVDHPDEAAQVADNGKRAVRSNYSKATIAHIISEALAGRSVISFG